MVTTVTIEKEKTNPAAATGIRDWQEYVVSCRAVMDRTQAFIEDTTCDEMINWGAGPETVPKLPPETVAKMVESGIGTSGIFTVVEPADLDAYRSYMNKPLTIPEKPEVAAILVDYNRGNPITRYQEGFVSVKAMCPDGRESWLVVSMPVPNLLMCYMGVAWGLPQYVADEMTVSPTRAEVKYQGEIRFSLELTSGPVEETEDALRARVAAAMGNAISFHPTKGGTCLFRWFGRGGGGTKFVDVQTGMVKVYVRAEDPWSRLIPANSVTPGLFQRIVATGGGDFVWEKVKG